MKSFVLIALLFSYSLVHAEGYYEYTVASPEGSVIDLSIDPTIADAANIVGTINDATVNGYLDPHYGMPSFTFTKNGETTSVTCSNDSGFQCEFTLADKSVEVMKFMGIDAKNYTLYFQFMGQVIPVKIYFDYYQSNHFYEEPILEAQLPEGNVRFQVSKPICWGLASHTTFLALGGYLVTK